MITREVNRAILEPIDGAPSPHNLYRVHSKSMFEFEKTLFPRKIGTSRLTFASFLQGSLPRAHEPFQNYSTRNNINISNNTASNVDSNGTNDYPRSSPSLYNKWTSKPFLTPAISAPIELLKASYTRNDVPHRDHRSDNSRIDAKDRTTFQDRRECYSAARQRDVSMVMADDATNYYSDRHRRDSINDVVVLPKSASMTIPHIDGQMREKSVLNSRENATDGHSPRYDDAVSFAVGDVAVRYPLLTVDPRNKLINNTQCNLLPAVRIVERRPSSNSIPPSKSGNVHRMDIRNHFSSAVTSTPPSLSIANAINITRRENCGTHISSY